jgi:hypothetical protein
MTRRLAVLVVFIVAIVAAPSLFAICHDCPDGTDCIVVDPGTGGYFICGWNPDGSCYSLGTSCLAPSSLQPEYRVAAVRVKVPGGKMLPDPQVKAALLASK